MENSLRADGPKYTCHFPEKLGNNMLSTLLTGFWGMQQLYRVSISRRVIKTGSGEVGGFHRDTCTHT